MTDSHPISVLFDGGQPAHVHLFRHAIDALERTAHFEPPRVPSHEARRRV